LRTVRRYSRKQMMWRYEVAPDIDPKWQWQQGIFRLQCPLRSAFQA
jgi:hypothetical protein